MNKILLYICIINLIESPAMGESQLASPVTNKAVITLQEAIQKALKSSPNLRSASSQLKAEKGAAQQAGAWPNPKFGVDIANFAGSGEFDNTRNAEITYSISQLIEVGGKNSYRTQIAKQSVVKGEYDVIISRLDLIRDVNLAFAEAVHAQKMLALAKERKYLENEMIKAVKKRVNSASTSAIQLRKAEIGLSTANLLVGKIEREFNHTRHVLASLWVGHELSFSLDDNEFDKLSAPPSEKTVEADLLKAVDLRLWNIEKDRAKATFKLEKAEAIPDPTISFGIRNLKRSDDRAFTAGVSIPIPVFNRNHGNIESARNTIRKVENDQVAKHITLQNEVFEWLEREINAYHDANVLQSDILPAAKEAFDLARAGYARGRFPYLEVLDAQRILFEAKEQYIEALKQYHIAAAQIARFTTPAGDTINE